MRLAAARIAVARVAMGATALFAAAWALALGPAYVKRQPIVDVGGQIVLGDVYDDGELAAMSNFARRSADAPDPGLPIAVTRCDEALSTASTLIDLRLAEGALAGVRPDLLPTWLPRVVTGAERSVQCAPQSGFAWLALYWGKGNLDGFDDGLTRFLVRSYEVAPREEWLARRRNLAGVRAWRRLPEAERTLVFEEWTRLLRGYAIAAAAISLVEAPDDLRARMIASRDLFDDRAWRQLGVVVERLEPRLVLPGAEGGPQRPWR